MNNLKSFQACITIMAKEQKRGKGGGVCINHMA